MATPVSMIAPPATTKPEGDLSCSLVCVLRCSCLSPLHASIYLPKLQLITKPVLHLVVLV